MDPNSLSRKSLIFIIPFYPQIFWKSMLRMRWIDHMNNEIYYKWHLFIFAQKKKTKTTKQKCLQLYYVNSYKHPLNKKQRKYKIKVPESRKKMCISKSNLKKSIICFIWCMLIWLLVSIWLLSNKILGQNIFKHVILVTIV